MYSFYRSCDESGQTTQGLSNCLYDVSHQSELVQYEVGCYMTDCRKKENNYVDDYAQDLRKLFYKAYPQTLQGTTDLENISKSILCNQFVAEATT